MAPAGGREAVEALLAAFEREARLTLDQRLPRGWTASWDGPVIRCTTPHTGFLTYRSLAGLTSAQVDATIDRAIEHFTAAGQGFEWKTYGHDWPADLPERLAGRGFVAEPTETVVVARTDQVAAEPGLPPGVRLRVATSEADLARIAALKSEVWDQDLAWIADDLAGRLADPEDHLTVLLAEATSHRGLVGNGRHGDHDPPDPGRATGTDAGGREEPLLVAHGWLERMPGGRFAGLWGGDTRAEWRRRGLYRALVARRAQLALAEGIEYLQVDASDNSRPILERLGFTAVTTTTPLVWRPSG